MSTTTEQEQHEAKREAQRQQRLRALQSSIPFIKTAAQLFDERAYREATTAAAAGREGNTPPPCNL